MRGIRVVANFRDNLIDVEILPRLVDGVLVANTIPDATGPLPSPPPSLPPAQSEPVHTGTGEGEESYTEPFIPLSSLKRREEPEARAESHAQHPQEVRNYKFYIQNGAFYCKYNTHNCLNRFFFTNLFVCFVMLIILLQHMDEAMYLMRKGIQKFPILFPQDVVFLDDPRSQLVDARYKAAKTNNVLVTSSCDHSICLWWKGSCQRCFRGYSGPVSTLSDKLLGEVPSKVLASSGEDGTIHLWSLSSSGKRGQYALKSTLYGHVKPIKLIFVAESSMDKECYAFVRVWDTMIASSASRSSCCVGRTSIPSAPVNMKCHESLLYVVVGSFVVAIDLRTMQKVNIVAVHQSKLYSFEALSSKSLICTGSIGSAMLWDIRRNQEPLKPEPIAKMDVHDGPVSYLHMDPYKIVTAGPEESYVNVWDVDTGTQTNALSSSSLPSTSSNCSGVAVNGCRIVTTHYRL
ncbi:hypothetical protein UlMin_030482 [Ulmus minor]